MTSEQDTSNGARLPLAERARRGLLADEPGLPLSELIELEHPTGGEARQSFKSALKMAIAYGDLTAPEREYVPLPRKPRSVYELQALEAGANPVRTVEPFIEREAYRTWRAQCPASLLSPLSKTAKWLGAPSLPQGEPEPLPQGEPGKPELGAAAKRTALKSLLTEIDLRANKTGAGFNRHSLPGTKDEFARLLKAHCPVFLHVGNERIAAYLKGTCQFQRGAKPEQGKGAAVWALFPEYPLK